MRKIFSLAAVTMLVLFTACAPSTDTGDYNEPIKDIAGSWQVIKIERNGEDITTKVNFSQFRVNFLEDGTYIFENYLPFVVSRPGTWSLDDKQYAFKINFLSDSQDVTSLEFSYPIVDGKRQIQISGSPGCSSNTYTYTLQSVSQ
ncbi:DUF5004 domain-containing protein [Flavobacterium psychrotrophum]|uniref:DUF5004 domain-containing protein n=1 Tax=Flavobacterium psychrotrophum TaxID=2294119 RepID=UPI000E30D2E5|nr:DUF5004 domain-containing protein [Flavobacterium psychrotrophum]